MNLNGFATHPGGDLWGPNGSPPGPLSDSYDPPTAEAHRGESTTTHLRDLMSSLASVTDSSVTESIVKEKSSARRKGRRVRTGYKVWSVARNRMVAIENGQVIGLNPMDCVSTALLRMRISIGQGPANGDVMIIDELLLIDRENSQLISQLINSGVIVKALIDVKTR